MNTAHRICPRHQVVIVTPTPGELDLQLEPLAQTHRGFESRPAPLTKTERDAVLANGMPVLGVQS